MARHGIITAIARNLGTTRKATGSSAIVSSASISSVTRIVPISAANAEPDRPITTTAVIRGPSSRVIEMDQARHQLHRADVLQLVCALQRDDDSDKEGDQRDDRDGADADRHGLMNGASAACGRA